MPHRVEAVTKRAANLRQRHRVSPAARRYLGSQPTRPALPARLAPRPHLAHTACAHCSQRVGRASRQRPRL